MGRKETENQATFYYMETLPYNSVVNKHLINFMGLGSIILYELVLIYKFVQLDTVP